MQDQGRSKGQGKAQGEGQDESQDFRGLTVKCGGWDSRTNLPVSVTPFPNSMALRCLRAQCAMQRAPVATSLQ
jgi:hypothetical protein